MKWLALLLVAFLGVAAYHAHVQSLKDAEEKAELIAYNQTQAQIEAERQARQRRPQMAVAKVLEPLLLQVQAPLNLEEPADLLPVVEGTKQRILDKQGDAEPARRVVFDRASAFLTYLAAVADERTKTLKSMLRNRGASTALNSANAGSFFNQAAIKRWDATLVRARPGLTQLLEQLRTVEREWNKQAAQDGSPELYDLAALTPTMIPADPQADGGSSLSRAITSPPASHGPRGKTLNIQGRTPGQ